MSSPLLPPQFNEPQWQEAIRRRELRRYALTLSDLANKIRITEDFSTKTPEKLAQLISEIARLLAEYIPSAPSDSLHEINDFLGRIAAHLRYVERAKVAQTPWSIVQTAEDFLKLQAGPNSNFIIRPTWSYNYSLVGEFWEFYRIVLGCWSWFPLGELQKRIPFGAEDTIYCISFPRTERQNCLLHANWGHEVGHIFAERWTKSNFAPLWSNAEAEIRKKIEDEVRKNPPPVDSLFKDIVIDNVVSRKTRTAMEAAQSGLRELVCDIIGVHLFGPSALAAALEFAARFELDVSPLECDFYPPWRYRLRVMANYCDQDLRDHEGIGYPGEVLRPFVEWLRKVFNLIAGLTDGQVINSKIETQEAYRFIEKNWETIQSQAIRLLPNESANPYRIKDRPKIIEKLVDRLRASIPPNECQNLSLRPASLQDIITAAWAFKMERIDRQGDWGSIEDFNLLFRLVLKGCESSFVHSTWGPKL